MGLTSSIHLQEIDEGDYENVIKIPQSDIHDAHDYLPDYFDVLIRTPDTRGFVLKKNDKYIAFAFVTIIDGKKGMVLRGVRVEKPYEGNEIITLLVRSIARQYIRLNLKTLITYNSNTASAAMTKIQEGTWNYVTMRKLNMFQAQRVKIPEITDEVPRLIQQINAYELECIFTNNELKKYLFPSGYFVAFRVPYLPQKTNISHIINYRSFLLKTCESGNIESTILSYGTYFICKEETTIFYHLDLYGNITSWVKDHIDIHLHRCVNLMIDMTNIIFCVTTSEWQDVDILYNIVRTYGFKKNTQRIGVMANKKLRSI